jgi:predicted permease
VLGRQVRSGGSSATIVGVVQPEFDFPRDVDVFVPLRAAWPEVGKQRYFRIFRAVALLAPGVTPEMAQAFMNSSARTIASTRPGGASTYGVLVTPFLDEIYGPARRAVWILMAAVVLVLLISCANAANLLLARATVRSRELALRTVLGAERGRLVLLLLTEAAVLGVLAAAAGIVLARVLIAGIAQIAPAEVPRVDQVELNLPVVLFGIGTAVATLLAFGLTPALLASRRNPSEALRQGGRTASADRLHTRALKTLMTAEVALSLILLVGAGLLIRGFQRLASIDPGFQAQNVLTFRITTNTGSQEKRRQLYGEVLERVRRLPGVESAAAVLIRPLSGLIGWDNVYTIEGQSPEQQKANPNGNYEAISPDYFRTMGIRLLAGRDFRAADTESAPGVVIINAGTARRHWTEANAVGRRIRLSADPKSPWLTVVGVVSDVRYREWEAARPDFYIPYTQRAQHRTDFVVKTSGDAAALAPVIRRIVFDIDPAQPISSVTTMERLVERTLSGSRFTTLVLSVLAACALGLAALGVYGVLSYAVAQRTAEIGIRMAVGATPGSIIRLVTGEGMRVTAVGIAGGLLAAAALTRVVSSVIYGVALSDPVAWTGGFTVLVVTAAIACAIPAVRAAGANPVRALAEE